MNNLQNLSNAIEKALKTEPVVDVLTVLTSHFVGLTVELVRRSGEDVNKQIVIDGGRQRDITIHAPKTTEGSQQ